LPSGVIAIAAGKPTPILIGFPGVPVAVATGVTVLGCPRTRAIRSKAAT
jgi:hypothetical protein